MRQTKIKEEAVFDKIIKQLPPNNDEYFIQRDKDINTYRVQRGKKIRVVSSSHKKSKTKSKKRTKKRHTVIPTGALLATGKIKRKYKQSARKAVTNKLLTLSKTAKKQRRSRRKKST